MGQLCTAGGVTSQCSVHYCRSLAKLRGGGGERPPPPPPPAADQLRQVRATVWVWGKSCLVAWVLRAVAPPPRVWGGAGRWAALARWDWI